MDNSSEKMIQRLRTSKAAAQAQAYANGQSCGRKWAEEAAEWSELNRLSLVRDEHRRRNQWDDLFDGIGSAWSAGEALHHMLMGGEDVDGSPDRAESASFWEGLGVLDEQQTDSRFVLGFADGAAEQYARVESQV